MTSHGAKFQTSSHIIGENAAITKNRYSVRCRDCLPGRLSCGALTPPAGACACVVARVAPAGPSCLGLGHPSFPPAGTVRRLPLKFVGLTERLFGEEV